MPLCVKCRRPNPTDKKRCPSCMERNTGFLRRRREELRKEGRCYDCPNPAAEGRLRCTSCGEKAAEASKRASQKAKLQALEAYGGAFCACCGETQILMLTLDHIDQNGAAKRRDGEGSGDRIYKILRSQGYPPGFRVLCRNCNYAVYFDPDHRCPHRRGCFG